MSLLEIALEKVNGEAVSLKSMSPNALESFMSVMSSLKALAVYVADGKELSFSISEGSALCVLNAPDELMDSIYSEMETAVSGESDDKEITNYLRSIQDQVTRENFSYRFLYKKPNAPVINLHTTLRESRKITVKRRRKQYTYKLKIISGFLNQIGGNIPNYHFDYGGGKKITIGCSVKQAKKVKQFLYQDVYTLVMCKEWYDEEKKDEYTHKSILEEDLVNDFRRFIISYNKEEDLLKKLSLIYEFTDRMFTEGKGRQALHNLLLAFNDKHLHLSELKTVLLIAKSFTESAEIQESRNALKITYNDKREKLKTGN